MIRDIALFAAAAGMGWYGREAFRRHDEPRSFHAAMIALACACLFVGAV